MGRIRKAGRERDIYRQANKEAKKEVARSKAPSMDEVYKELETPEGERKIYRIAKARDKSAKDFTQIRQIKDEQGVILWEHDKIIERWKGYYGNLLNEENPRTVFGGGVPIEGLTPAIDRKEVGVSLKGMKIGEAMGPDGIPMEVWKSLGEEGVDMLLDLLQKIFEQEKMPEEYEGQRDCANIQREGGHPGLWELQRHQYDFTHHEDLGKSNRPKTEGRDNHRRRAVRFHAGKRDN